MGKRKRNVLNVVKVELSDLALGTKTILPVVVQHSSRDGRRIEQAIHQISTPQQDSPPPTFNPSPVVDDMQDLAPRELREEMDEPNGPGRVRLCSCSSIWFITCSPLTVGPTASLACRVRRFSVRVHVS